VRRAGRIGADREGTVPVPGNLLRWRGTRRGEPALTVRKPGSAATEGSEQPGTYVRGGGGAVAVLCGPYPAMRSGPVRETLKSGSTADLRGGFKCVF